MSRLEIDGLCATDAAEAVLLDVYYIYEFSHSDENERERDGERGENCCFAFEDIYIFIRMERSQL